ncbi:putative Chitinase [Quillaja saponaria]|uniref:Chitinase n=1 Tax=Quillaja saponaria TaxID=32244 RepID=A0AAD7VKV8_QUISA|nr:putative Chitinase [Quillaja saponaria]
MNENLDLINAMCYDFHGSWNRETGAIASLFDPKSNVNTLYGLQSWIQAGALPSKLVMGMPLYGRTWQLQDPNVHGIGAPTIGVGPGDGAMAFFQVEQFNTNSGATVVYDVDTVSVYSYSGTSWIGYEDPITVTAKVGFAQALGLRGYFFWAVGYDSQWKISKQGTLLQSISRISTNN